MKLSEFEVLSFDCYGTLIDWGTGILAALRPWVHLARPAIEDAEILRAFAEAEAAEEAANPRVVYPAVLAGVHRRLAEAWGLDPDAARAVEFGASVGRWPAYPDSPASLASLAQTNRLVILSNVDRTSFAASRARLGVTFDAVYTAEDIGSYKPDPANFVYLIESEARQGFSADRILHVGQSLYHDHVPASRAGLATDTGR